LTKWDGKLMRAAKRKWLLALNCYATSLPVSFEPITPVG
jgi:hypothetical protein